MTSPLNINLLIGAASTPSPPSTEGFFHAKFSGDNANGDPYTTGPYHYIWPYRHIVDSTGATIIACQASLDNNDFNMDSGLVKIAADGTLVWIKHIGYHYVDGVPTGSSDSGYGVTVDEQDNIYFVGSSSNGLDQFGFIVKVSPDGDEIWQKVFTNDLGSPQFSFSDVGYFGNHICVTGSNDLGASLWKLDLDGSVVWQRSFEDSSATNVFTATTLAFDNTGNIFLVCSKSDLFGGEATLLTKWSSTGTRLWVVGADSLGGSHYGRVRLCATSDGCAVVSYINSDGIQLIKYGLDGSQIWSKQATPDGNAGTDEWNYNDYTVAIGAGPDGDVFVSCGTDTWYASFIRVLHFNADGSLAWERAFNCGMQVGSDYWANTDVTVKDGVLYIVIGAMGDGIDRINAVHVLRVPVDSNDEMSFGGKSGFQNIHLLLYQSRISSTTISNIPDPFAYWNISDVAPVGEAVLNHVLEVLDVSEFMLPVTVLPLDPPVTLTGDSWAGLFANQTTPDDAIGPFLSQCVTDSSGNIYSVGYGYNRSVDNNQHTVLIKTSPEGDVIWQKIYGDPKSLDSMKMAIDGSGNLYIAGDPYQTGVVFWKLDSNGDTIWWKQYDFTSNYWTVGGLVTSGTDLYAVAHNNAVGSSIGYLFKFNAAGTLVMQKKYTGDAIISLDGLLVLANGDIITAGASLQTPDGYEVLIMRLDSSGNIIKQRFLGIEGIATDVKHDVAWQLRRDASDNFYLVGDTCAGGNGSGSDNERKLLLAKYDSNLNLIWTRQYHSYGDTANLPYTGNTTVTDFIPVVVTASVPSWIRNITRRRNILLLKFDLDGNQILCQSLNTGGESGVLMETDLYGGFTCDGEYVYWCGESYSDWNEAGILVKVPVDGVVDGVYDNWFVRPFTWWDEGTANITNVERAGNLVKVTDPTLSLDSTAVPAQYVLDSAVTLHVQPLS